MNKYIFIISILISFSAEFSLAVDGYTDRLIDGKNQTIKNTELAKVETCISDNGKPLISTNGSFVECKDKNSNVVDYDKSMNQCEADLERATACCNSDIQGCLNSTSGGQQAIVQLLSAAQPLTALLGQGGNMAQACVMYNTFTKSKLAFDAYALAMCTKRKKSCQSSCRQAYQGLNEIDPVKDSKRYDGQKSLMDERVAQCDSLEVDILQTIGMISKTVATIELVKTTCIDPLTGETTLAGPMTQFPTDDVQPDCTQAANISHPSCQELVCNGPLGPTTPGCANYNTAEGGEIFGPDSVNSQSVSLDDDLQDFDLGQEPQIGDIQSQSLGLNGGSSGGGGGGVGSAGDIGGLGAAPAATGAQEVNSASKLQGASLGGQKGYSSRSGRWKAGSGGGGGYRYKTGRPGYGVAGKAKYKSKFNLKKFIPKNKVNGRSLAGKANGMRVDIGAKHEDIWNRMSNRYFSLCVTNKLFKCQSMLRRK